VSTKQITPVTAGFESLKQTNEHNAEYWRARDLQPLLGYAQWRRFEQAVERAMTSCDASGNQAAHHFAGAGKPIVGVQTYEQVGKEVRDAIRRIGGTLPENIPPAEHIKEVEKRIKHATPKLTLGEREANGLLGGKTKP
jgi:hypothetical protein